LLSLGLTFAETTLYGNVDQAWNKVTKKSGGNLARCLDGLSLASARTKSHHAAKE
jgi:hypothetical protein